MNELTRQLADACRQRPLEEKWLIAPTLRVGHQWLDAATRAGQPIVSVHIKTLKSVAVDLAAGKMAKLGLSLASHRASALLIDRVVAQLQQRHLRYLHAVELGTGLAETLLGSIEALRLAGLSAEDLDPEHFEVPAKGEDIAAIMSRLETELVDERLIDYAALLELAIRTLRDETDPLGTDTLVLLPQDLDCAARERDLLDAIPSSQQIAIAVDSVASHAETATDMQSDRERLRWLLTPRESGTPLSDDSVRLVRTIGEVNEVRHALRSCLAETVRWDEVELLHTDRETYVPLIYETLSALPQCEDLSGDQLPVTFAEGISCRYARPGRALAAWLTWIHGGYHQNQLVRMLKEGLLLVPDDGQSVSGFARLGGLLRRIEIGLGRERYLPAIDDHLASLQEKLANTRRDQELHDDIPFGRSDWIERDITDVQAIRKLVDRLLSISPTASATYEELIPATEQFVADVARSANRLDRFASDKLGEELEDMRHWLGRCKGQTGVNVWQWLMNLPFETRVLGSGPRPGCLHVDNIASGGHTDRANTFILGLDDSRFPGTGLQDSLVLDRERRRLSGAIPTAASRVEQRVEDLVRLPARLRGKVTLSYACSSVTDDREMFPSSALVSAYRIVSGDVDGDQQDLIDWLPSPISFAPSDSHYCLDGSEWWLWRLTTDDEVENAISLVLEEYPHLRRGRRAIEKQTSNEFTEFDGHVEVAGDDLDPTAPTGPIMSASRLQTLARCPRAFYFEYGLKITPPDELVIDPAKWLDPLAFGSLIHELFEQFMRELVTENKLPEFHRDQARLQRLLDEYVERYKQWYPAPNASAFQRQCRQLRRTAETFLREEERLCKQHHSQPLYFEASLGMSPEGEGTSLDSDEPISVELANQKSMRARGRVDRIDRLGGGAVETYAIWDYKSGSTYGYDLNDPLRQGRKVQPYLYATIVAHRLREAVSPQAGVAYFGFFFPGVRAVGRRLQWTPEQLAEGASVLELLCETVARGAFVPTTDHKQDCKFCDYRSICGDTERVAGGSQAMLSNPSNTVLEPFRKLRGIDIETA